MAVPPRRGPLQPRRRLTEQRKQREIACSACQDHSTRVKLRKPYLSAIRINAKRELPASPEADNAAISLSLRTKRSNPTFSGILSAGLLRRSESRSAAHEAFELVGAPGDRLVD